MKNNHETHQKTNHAPGTGSDKHHPETPTDANTRFNKQEKQDNIQKNPDKQKTG